jgi:hypothetical protein
VLADTGVTEVVNNKTQASAVAAKNAFVVNIFNYFRFTKTLSERKLAKVEGKLFFGCVAKDERETR